jgi:hypothetical protein
MAKSMLSGFRISGDVIDAVVGTVQPEEPDVPDTSLSHNASGSIPEASPPVGAEYAGPEGKTAPANQYSGEELTSERDGLFLVFHVAGTTYRLGGVKSLFVTSLRVNIRATNGETSYYDSIDLYASRGRAAFAQGVNRAWGAEPVRIERDLVLILERLEKDRDESLKASGKREPVDMTAAEREAGLELLRDPRLFDRIVSDLASLGYVGENLNKQLLYLCASSRKLDDPVSVLILSQSASGKSFLVDCVKRLMPPEEVVAVTSLSDQALNYIDDLSHKFLVLGEAVHGEVVEYQIRKCCRERNCRAW